MKTQTIVTREIVPEDRRVTVTAEIFGSRFPIRIERGRGGIVVTIRPIVTEPLRRAPGNTSD